MRVTNAKKIDLLAEKSKRMAKRAALLALLATSGSTLCAQGLSGGRSAYGPGQHGPGQQNLRIYAAGVGVVQPNPFFVATPPAQSPAKQISADQPLIADKQTAPLQNTKDSLDQYLRQETFVPTKLETPKVAVSSPSPIPDGSDTGSALVPISKPNLASMKIRQYASPISITGNESSVVIPVVDARDEQTVVNETAPYSFSFSDETAVKVEQHNETNATSSKTPSQETQPTETHSEDSKSAKEQNVSTKSINQPAKSKSGTTQLTSVVSPVKLAPMIDFSKPTVAPKPVESGEPVEQTVQPRVHIDSLPTRASDVEVKKGDDQPKTIDSRSDVGVKFSGEVAGNAIDSPVAVNESQESTHRAISVASLPVRIDRPNDDGGQGSSPVVGTVVGAVTHEPSMLPVTPNHNGSTSLRQIPAHAASVRGNRTARSVLKTSAHRTMRSGDSSTVTPTSLASSKTNARPLVLHLSRAQVRSMTIGGDLRRVSVADKDVCQAFESGANQVKLIGTGLGRTMLTIWADVVPGEPTRKKTFIIEVADGVNATGDKVAEHTALLNDSIDRTFPRASVVVSRRGGELNVTGRCDSETDAKQIIRMVRKSCLVPVIDNLQVR